MIFSVLLDPISFQDFSDVDTSPPLNSVLVGLAPTHFNYDRMSEAFSLLHKDPSAKLVAVNKSRYFKKEGGSTAVGTGAFEYSSLSIFVNMYI